MTRAPAHRVRTHAEVLADFHPVGNIERLPVEEGASVQVVAQVRSDSGRAGVYAWVEEKSDGTSQILYIGKSGQTIKQRHHSGHNNGFKHSARGKAHATILWEALDRGSKVTIHALHPDPVHFLDDLIEVHGAVEDYLLAVTQPTPVRNREANYQAEID